MGLNCMGLLCLDRLPRARSREEWKYVAQVSFWLSTWYVCSLVNLLMVKTLLSEKGCTPVGIGLVQMSVTALFGAIKVLGPEARRIKLWKNARIKRKRSSYPIGDEESPRGRTEEERSDWPEGDQSDQQLDSSVGKLMRKPQFWNYMVLLGALRVSTVVLGLVSLSYVAASFTETIKASAPLATVLFAWLILGERTSLPVFLSLFPVMGGLILCASSEISFHMVGFLAALLNNFLDCIQNIFSKKMMESLVTPVQLQFFTSVAGSFFQLPVMLWQLKRSASLEATAEAKPAGWEVSAYVLICAVFFHMQSVSAYCTMALVSPVTQSVANTLKRTLMIFISILYFGNAVVASSVGGILMVISGVALYNYFRILDTPPRTAPRQEA
ncbi:sugar phosphate transporter [Chloropicon primus]|uniref:Sugar phosphate transporter n=1 Tax=Chloropicon primus TaxID=1764295 RepID=A0A5B8MP53_9CHLO|nr:sugar phosphate transporter [Chloropicon primus]|eukprot:QDZ22091.1 sugar phosphate transporter [Chloropicon primus]